MSALGNSNRTNKTYLSIVNGKIAQRVKPETPNAVKRFSEKAQKEFHELLYDYITGKIVAMELSLSDYGEELKIDIENNGLYQLQIPVDSRFFETFANRLSKADLNKEIRTIPYSFKDEKDKTRSGVNLFHKNDAGVFNVKIEPLYTKDNQGNIPPFPNNPVPSEQKEDIKVWRIQVLRIYKKIINQHIEILKQLFPETQTPPSDNVPTYHSPGTPPPANSDDDSDDLPF